MMMVLVVLVVVVLMMMMKRTTTMMVMFVVGVVSRVDTIPNDKIDFKIIFFFQCVESRLEWKTLIFLTPK